MTDLHLSNIAVCFMQQRNFLLERGNKPEKGVDVEMGGCRFSITLQFNYIYCV